MMVADAVPPRFLADAMLGRLARWLRTLGFDTRYDPAIHDPELVAPAAAEGRVLLTRDRHPIEHLRPGRALLVTDEAPLAQLRQVVEACHLAPPAEPFTRCLVCNGALRSATPAEAATRVPEASRALPGPVLSLSRLRPRILARLAHAPHARDPRRRAAGVDGVRGS
ncbi:MAG TPA: Mut7-C RNAse domain-containing protein [Longimicrobium sp.]|nr:Mut7-C RNAse domain-containing protein [Longimicrobium sp.]